jgi:hypothetical protein
LILANAETTTALNAASLNAGTTGGGLAFSAIGSLSGNALALTLSNNGVTITISAANNAGTLTSGAQTLAFAGVSDLTGGTGDDTLRLQNGFGLTGSFDGGGGANTLDLTLFGAPVTVDIGAATATGLGGGFARVLNFRGSSGAGDAWIGPAGNSTWTLAATSEVVQGALQAFFEGFESLTTGAGNDLISIRDGATITSTDLSAGGADELDYGLRSGAVLVDLQAATATGLGAVTGLGSVAVLAGNTTTTTLSLTNAANTIQLTGIRAGTVDGALTFSAVTLLDAAGGADALLGSAAGSTWSLTGANSGTVDTLAFANVESVTGGTGADNYSGTASGSLTGALADAGGASQLQGVLRAGSISLGTASLAADTVCDTSAAHGAVTLGALTGNNHSLRVATGSGLKTFNGAVAGLASPLLAALVLEGSGAADFAGAVGSTAGGIDASAASAVTFRGPVALGNGGTGSTFAGPVTFDAAAPISFSGFDGLAFNGGITVSGAALTLNSQGSALTFAGLDAGGQSVTLNAGAGTLDLLSQNITNLNQLTVTAALSRLASVTGTGTQAYTGALRVSGTLTAPRLEFSGAGAVTAADGTSALLTAADQIFLDKAGSGPVRFTNDRALQLSAGSALNILEATVTAGDLTLGSGISASTRIGLTTTTGGLFQTAGTLAAPVIDLQIAGQGGTSANPIRTAAGTQLILGLGGDAFLVEQSRTQLGTGILYTGGGGAQVIDLTLTNGAAQLAADFGDAGDDFIVRVTLGGLQQSSGRFAADSLTIIASGAIGTAGNPLLTRAALLNLTSGGSGGTFASDFDAVEFTGAAGSGNITITAAGTLTVSGNITTIGSVLLRSTGGNIEGSTLAFPTITADTLVLDAPGGAIVFNNLALVLNSGLGSAAGSVDLGNLQIGTNLTITTTGAVTQSGALQVGGLFTINAPGQSVVLDNAGNQFGALRIQATSATVREADAMVINFLDIAGAAILRSGGSITQAGAVTAASLALEAAGSILLTHLDNQIPLLGNVTRGGEFRLFTRGDLAVNGNIATGTLTNDVELVAAGNLTLQPGARIAATGTGNDIIAASRLGNFADLSGSATALDPAGGARFVIYSGNRVQTDTGLLTVNFIQLSSPYPAAPSGAGNALLVREGVPGDTTIVIVVPLIPSVTLSGLNVGDFGLRSIEIGTSSIGLGLRSGGASAGGLGLFQVGADGQAQALGEDAAEALRELRRTLQQDMSEAAKDEILQALADILAGRLDPREVPLPPGLVYQENSLGNSVIVPPELALEFLISLLDPANYDHLMRTLSNPPQP